MGGGGDPKGVVGGGCPWWHVCQGVHGYGDRYSARMTHVCKDYSPTTLTPVLFGPMLCVASLRWVPGSYVVIKHVARDLTRHHLGRYMIAIRSL